jgi:AraC-like DNA-binding protein
MDNTSNYLDYLIMKYFRGINFISNGNNPNSNDIMDRRFGDYYGLQFNYSGCFAVSVENGPEKIVKGPHVLVTRPGVLFKYGAVPGKTRHHCYLCFNGPRVKKFSSEGLLPRSSMPLFEVRNGEKFMQMFNELTGCIKLGPAGHDRAVHLLEGLLLELREDKKLFEPGGILTNPILNLADEIRSHPELEWNFTMEAERLNISYPHFRRVFRSVMHCPPGRFVNICRLEKAASLLINGLLTMAEVAEQVGIMDQQYFSRLFKKQFQLPPATYRREFGY